MDYLLTYEQLVLKYGKISQLAYDENLKIGTVLKGLPNELRKHILVGLRPDTKYEEIRTRLLEYERSTQSWNAENILQSFSMDSMYKSSSNNSNYQGPQPMEIDRINGKGQDKGKGKGKGKGKFGKGGKGQDGYPFGKGRGRGSDHKGHGRDGKGRGRSSFTAKGARAVGEYGCGKSKGKGKDSKGKSKFEGTCYNCGKTGHKASECYQKNVRSVDEVQEDWNAATASSSQQTPQGSTTRTVAAEAAPRTRRITDVVEEDEEINFLHLSREFDELMRGACLRCIWIDLSDGENEEHGSPDAVFSWMKSDVEFYGTSTQKEFDLTLGDELEDFGKPLEDFSSSKDWYEDPGREDPVESSLRGREDPVESSLRGREDPVESSLRGREDPLESNLRGREDPVAVNSCEREGNLDVGLRARMMRVDVGNWPNCEVVLDSGADCHVLPMSWSQDVGETSKMEYLLKDAQGNVIPTCPVRQNVVFEFTKENGKKLRIVDVAACGNVTQPLFAVGKMWKLGWSTVHEDGSLWLKKSGVRVPIYLEKNSSMASMSIYKVTQEKSQDPMKLRPVTLADPLREDLKDNLYAEGWFALKSGNPARFDWETNKTYDPTGCFPARFYEDVTGDDEEDYFPYRTTFVGNYVDASAEELEVNWSSLDIFGCAEEWKRRETVEFDRRFDVVVTLLERTVKGPEEYGLWTPLGKREKKKEVVEESEEVAVEPNASGSSGAPILKEDETESLVIGHLKITPESSLKEMKEACKFMFLSKHGSKELPWKRLKKECAVGKMKVAVQISEDVRKEFEREPIPESLPALPDQETIEKHELTHLPRAPWCEACQAAKSREDNFEESEKPQRPVFSLDYMFTGTRNEENPKEPKDPLAIQLVGVDSDTKFMLSLPVPLKGGEATIMAATKEVVRVLALLGYEDVVLRTDTEPVMLSIRKNVQLVRNRQGLKTELQDGAPDQHQGLQVERYVQTIRNLAKTLLATVEQRSGCKVGSDVPLYSWAFRHAAWLQNRFHVGRDGRTAFEVVVDPLQRKASTVCVSRGS